MNGTESQQGSKGKGTRRNTAAGVRAAVRRQKELRVDEEDRAESTDGLYEPDEGRDRAVKKQKVSEGTGNGGDVRTEQNVFREKSERSYVISDDTLILTS